MFFPYLVGLSVVLMTSTQKPVNSGSDGISDEWNILEASVGADSTDPFANVFDNSHIETEQYYMNILSEDLKPIVSDLRNIHMKDSNTASDIDYQSMVKNIIDNFATQIPTTADDDTESSNDAYINGLLLLFCKNPEMKVTQPSVEEKQTLKEIFSRSKPAKEHRKLRRRNPKL